MMKDQNSRVGIIASSTLAQHQLQVVISAAGYDVAVNTSPERLNKKFLSIETIGLWVVELEGDEQWSDFIHEILELTDAPILFGDGSIPGKNDVGYMRWCKRMSEKLKSLVPVQEKPISAPEINLDSLQQKSVKPRFELPDTLKLGPSPELGPIWVLCASLGGPQAVKDFLDLLPGDIPASFLYAQHIDEGCLAALVQSVGRHTALQMESAEHGIQMRNGFVGVVPVNNEIVFTESNHVLWKDNPWSGPYGPSHDHLLKNVSEQYGKRCNAIIFSGMGSDGSLGSSIVVDNGGIVWSQSPETCIQSSMPDSAGEAGTVSWRGEPAEMAEKLLRWLADGSSEAA